MLLGSKVASWWFVRGNVAKTPGVFNLDTKGKCVTSVILRRFTRTLWCTYFDMRLDGFWNPRGRSCGSESIIEMRTAFFVGYIAAIIGNCFLTFRDNLSVSTSRKGLDP
jgi:hypothetical protein